MSSIGSEKLTEALRHTVAMVLAGGQGERLAPLTRDRAKPAVPFGGVYRIIDFTLSNCIHSGIRRFRVLRFSEKPAEPETIPGRPDTALVSMGIYVFSTDRLVHEIEADAAGPTQHDFGRNVVPGMVERGLKVYAFPFRDRNSGASKY